MLLTIFLVLICIYLFFQIVIPLIFLGLPILGLFLESILDTLDNMKEKK